MAGTHYTSDRSSGTRTELRGIISIDINLLGCSIGAGLGADLLLSIGSGCGQVVLLTAGLDTWALRLPWPSTVTVFELDLPEVFAFKEAVPAWRGAVPTCERRIVPVDLRGNWADVLAAAGFDLTVPTAWLAEGLLLYLAADEAARLLTAVGELSTPGSQLAFEHGGIAGAALLAQARGIPAMKQYTPLWQGGLGEDAKIAAVRDQVDGNLREWVGELRSRNVGWERIGASLGMTRQLAWKRFK
ncbi:SAM-dependent methyltransferase [Nocardia brevicatena]|uniref:SAM-dependent methyltransferase n=1 Tax=Nocardia brevicatena TaxID=37327 RepID=UPI0002E801BB|nr:SAM-dependent methyltransferase [Nocardia brevicatena]